MKKIYNVLSLALIFIILSMPMLRHIQVGDKKTSTENRNLIQRPAFPLNIKDINHYTQLFDNYLSDQFGYRTVFINKANQIRYKLFNETTSKQLSVGKDGFIFLNSHSAKHPYSLIKEVCGINPLSKKSQNRIPSTLSSFIKKYSYTGIKTYVAIIPSKSRLYPEKLSSYYSKKCLSIKETPLDKILHKENNPFIYYPLQLLKQWKKEFPVYLPKHFHWNGKMPYEVADDIMKNLFYIQPSFEMLPVKTIVDSDLNRHLQGIELKEPSMSYDYEKLKVKECRGKTCTRGLANIYKNGYSFNYKFDNGSGRKLLLLTDSFGAGIAEHFIRGFDEVTMINTNDLTNTENETFYKNIVALIKPTHLMYLMHDGGVIWRTIKLERVVIQN